MPELSPVDLANVAHVVFVFLPFILLFSQPLPRQLFAVIMLLYMLAPLHWAFFDDECVSTMLTRDTFGGLSGAVTNSAFSETYLGWLYRPIAAAFGWKWDAEGISKVVHVHWTAIFVSLWFITFYRYKWCDTT